MNLALIKGSVRMLFIAILKHSPENCFMRPENAKASEEPRKRFENIEELEKKTGVKLLGAYMNINEHTAYFILETDDYTGVSRFLGPQLLTHRSAKITPVIKMEEAQRALDF